MPLYCTVNPRTGAVDYIRMAIDFLSVESFRVLKSALTADLTGNDILEVCPLYLNEDHFQTALPHFKKVLKVNRICSFGTSFLCLSDVTALAHNQPYCCIMSYSTNFNSSNS